MTETSNPLNTALVTGGCGFIGSHVALYLQKQNISVVVLDDLSGGTIANLPKNVTFIEGSITDAALIDQLFEDYKFDHVFHLASYAAENLSHYIRRFNYETNLIGSINLINSSIRSGNVKRFVFTSSIAVYGSISPPMDENDPAIPEDPYGIAKLAIEQDLVAANSLFGLEYTIFRPHNVYGINQNLRDPYRNVIGIFMRQLLNNEPMTIFGDGLQTRAFTYIDDIAPIIAESINVPDTVNQVFNIGSETFSTVKEISTLVSSALDRPYDAIHLKERTETTHAYCSHDKLKQVFDLDKPTPLETGIKKMGDWAKQLPFQSPTPFTNIEIKFGGPENWNLDS